MMMAPYEHPHRPATYLNTRSLKAPPKVDGYVPSRRSAYSDRGLLHARSVPVVPAQPAPDTYALNPARRGPLLDSPSHSIGDSHLRRLHTAPAGAGTVSSSAGTASQPAVDSYQAIPRSLAYPYSFSPVSITADFLGHPLHSLQAANQERMIANSLSPIELTAPVDGYTPVPVNPLKHTLTMPRQEQHFYESRQHPDIPYEGPPIDNYVPSPPRTSNSAALVHTASYCEQPPEGYGAKPTLGNGPLASVIDPSSIPAPSEPIGYYTRPNLPIHTAGFPPLRSPSPFRPSGRRRALLVGIHYSGEAELNGPINDVKFTRYLLRNRFGFARHDFQVLTDRDPGLPGTKWVRPTRRNIIEGLRWLVRGAQAGDSLWFSFSGHGAQIQDTNDDEIDGLDEAILPEDYLTEGYIIDDEMHHILVGGTPPGARLTVLLDACHTGTGMDLPCAYERDGSYSYTGRLLKPGSRLLSPIHSLKKSQSDASEWVSIDNPGMSSSNGGEVLLFSGCKDDQMSAENHNGASTTGVMTYILTGAMERAYTNNWGPYNYLQLMEFMRTEMNNLGMRHQTPQFSTSHPFDLTSPFCI